MCVIVSRFGNSWKRRHKYHWKRDGEELELTVELSVIFCSPDQYFVIALLCGNVCQRSKIRICNSKVLIWSKILFTRHQSAQESHNLSIIPPSFLVKIEASDSQESKELWRRKQ
jgi:hypothetical protein